MSLRSAALLLTLLLAGPPPPLLARAAAEAGPAEATGIELPDPFADLPASELIRAVYPDFDPASGLLGTGIRDEEGSPLAGQLYDAVLRKGEAEPTLLVLVETFPLDPAGQRPDYGAAEYGLDLAAFTLVDGRARLAAQLRGADAHSGHSELHFDQAPYRVTPELRAFGLRESYLHMGHHTQRLHLFVHSGSTFRPVFERPMLDTNLGLFDDGLDGELSAEQMARIYEPGTEQLAYRDEAVLVVVPGPGDTNDFKIVETRLRRQPDGSLHRETLTELWGWDPVGKTYFKRG